MPRLTLIKNLATARVDPVIERSADQAIADGHRYSRMNVEDNVKAFYGDQLNEGPLDPELAALARRRNVYEDGRASGNAKVQYGNQVNTKTNFWDDP